MKTPKLKKKVTEMTDAELLRSVFPKELINEAKKVGLAARKKVKK